MTTTTTNETTTTTSSSSSSSNATTAATTTANTSTRTTQSIAILIGKSIGGKNGSNNNNKDGIPMVVWTNEVRTIRDSPDDPWKHTLTYYEFLDASQRWSHLDALLTRLAPIPRIHVATCEHTGSSSSSSSSNNAKKSKKQASSRMERLLESLQLFLEQRSEDLKPQQEEEAAETALQVHLHVPTMDANRLESIVMNLLVNDPDVQLAYRGNVQMAHNTQLQQGLCLWLRGEGLLSTAQPTMDDSSVYVGSMHLESGILTSHLTLDRTAAHCIHLLPPPNVGVASVVGGTSSNNSILGILSSPCLTKMGKTKMQIWVRQPLVQLQPLLQRQRAVETLVQGIGKDIIRDALRTFSGMDLHSLASTLRLYSANDGAIMNLEDDKNDDDKQASLGSTKKPLQALYQLYLLSHSKVPQLLNAMTELRSSTQSQNQQQQSEEAAPCAGLLDEAHQNVVKLNHELDRCQGLVEAVLDLEQAPKEYFIRPAFAENLQQIAKELEEVQALVQDELERMQEEWESGGSGGAIRLESQDDRSWQFRLPNTNDIKTLQSINGVYVHRVLKNGVYFSTVQLQQLSTNYQDLNREYEQQSRKVVQDAMQVAATYETVVERAAEIVATLDVLCALAHVAAYSPHGYCKPTLTDGEEEGMGIKLTGARHPCVELQPDVENYIANDIDLRFGKSNFLLVTGPNMGGKSTFIRALGAIVTMAQIGSYVPCEAATINLCHSILARVGAGDLQERGISTFMAEMLESSSILRTATKRSLLIIDELGRGTSTFDGYGLARAISEYIYQRIGCMVVFATHFHELTNMEHELPGVHNCHVTAQKGQQGLRFLYHVQPGPCLESFGIQVAEMARVPAPVIEDAKRKALHLESFQSRTAKRQATEDKAFLQSFRKLQLPEFLQQSFKSDNEKKQALLNLLMASN